MSKLKSVESTNGEHKPAVPDLTNVVELDEIGDDHALTAQELLTMLSRRTDIEDILIIMPQTKTDELGELYQDVAIASAGDEMSNAHINWLCDKVKLHILGVEV